MELLFRKTILHPMPPKSQLAEVHALLSDNGLTLDADAEVILTAQTPDGRLAGCAALARDVAKCFAVSSALRGEGVALSLMTELTALAWEMGRKDLFLYTKPENEDLFTGCGFTTLASVPGSALLMENNKHRLPLYREELTRLRRPGDTIASLVMNCNPFTLGHRYLVEEAARRSDWVHLFVVREDLSLFPYPDRLRLIQQGVAGISNVTVHPGSVYILSRATFPSYFLKDAAVIEKAYTGIDIQIFRRYIAPALGITHRLAGTEPLSPITQRYNDDMTYWLSTPNVPAPPITFTVIPRRELGGEPISASRVRALWQKNEMEAVRELVPPTTYTYLQNRNT